MALTDPTTTTEHLRLGQQRDVEANAAYDLAETTHDRALAWQYRRQAEQLVQDADRHFAAAEARS